MSDSVTGEDQSEDRREVQVGTAVILGGPRDGARVVTIKFDNNEYYLLPTGAVSVAHAIRRNARRLVGLPLPKGILDMVSVQDSVVTMRSLDGLHRTAEFSGPDADRLAAEFADWVELRYGGHG